MRLSARTLRARELPRRYEVSDFAGGIVNSCRRMRISLERVLREIAMDRAVHSAVANYARWQELLNLGELRRPCHARSTSWYLLQENTHVVAVGKYASLSAVKSSHHEMIEEHAGIEPVAVLARDPVAGYRWNGNCQHTAVA